MLNKRELSNIWKKIFCHTKGVLLFIDLWSNLETSGSVVPRLVLAGAFWFMSVTKVLS